SIVRRARLVRKRTFVLHGVALADVEGGDAEAQEIPADRGKPGLLHATPELLGARELIDRGRQIGVRILARAASGDPRSDAREKAVEVEPIRGADRTSLRRRELEDGEAAAGTEDARHLREAAVEALDVPDAESHGHRVERAVGKR